MSVKFKDYYEILGVSRDSSLDDVKKTYRKLARKYHPDVNKSPQSEAKFKEINEAYEVLGDPEKRKKYDQLGSNWQNGQDFQPPPGWENIHFDFKRGDGDFSGFQFGEMGGGGFSDFFEMFFGQGMTGSRSRKRSKYSFSGDESDDELSFIRPENTEASITITLEEAYQGAVKKIRIRTENQRSGSITEKTYEVKIPRGTAEGSLIRLAGQGVKGHWGKSGDLYLRVHLAPHPVFKPAGYDLEMELPLFPWEAALGARVTIPTLDGKATLSVPARTQEGARFRLRGKGLPVKNSDQNADLFARVKIVNPENLSPQGLKLFKELSEEFKGVDPRKRFS
ncbi:MAG: DnaJ domain-containing protein [Candidatus Aureabacteria bacterium]|nr:DnaJ domain-containing protein [Candidatus Auribacterota bacterium]